MLAPGDMPIFEIERGGDVTYHGPGQLVGYPIFCSRDDERDLHVYLRNLEEALIRAVRAFGSAGRAQERLDRRLDDGRRAQARVDRRRGQTLGDAARVRAQRLDRSRRASRAINPCGLEATVMGSMSGVLGKPVALDEVKAAIRDAFADVFGRTFEPAALAQSDLVAG